VNLVETVVPKTISPEVPEELLTDRGPEAARIVRDNWPELALKPVIRSVTMITIPDIVPALAGTPPITPVVEIARFAGRFVALQE
jgi:hypothetical protein